jgi:NAD(P)-dependent dehydrogenase (short-subunit alcohol dehydrogenase family)
MGAAARILILGGYGVFGRLLAKELLERTPHEVILAGRSQRNATVARGQRGHGDRIRAAALDLHDPDSIVPELANVDVVVCAAGPFQGLSPQLVLRAVAAGVHWLDISDDPEWIASVVHDTEIQQLARERDLVVAPGMSTSPAISSALAALCLKELPSATSVRTALFIGNRNPKGAGVIASALASCRSPLEDVDLLAYGHRQGWLAPSADAVVFGAATDCATRFVLAPEWRLGARLLRGVARLGMRGERPARVLARLARWSSVFGENRGSIDVAVHDAAGNGCAMACTGDQRMAILPCAIALEGMHLWAHQPLSGADSRRHRFASLTAAKTLIDELRKRGMMVRGPTALGPHATSSG